MSSPPSSFLSVPSPSSSSSSSSNGIPPPIRDVPHRDFYVTKVSRRLNSLEDYKEEKLSMIVNPVFELREFDYFDATKRCERLSSKLASLYTWSCMDLIFIAMCLRPLKQNLIRNDLYSILLTDGFGLIIILVSKAKQLTDEEILASVTAQLRIRLLDHFGNVISEFKEWMVYFHICSESTASFAMNVHKRKYPVLNGLDPDLASGKFQSLVAGYTVFKEKKEEKKDEKEVEETTTSSSSKKAKKSS